MSWAHTREAQASGPGAQTLPPQALRPVSLLLGTPTRDIWLPWGRGSGGLFLGFVPTQPSKENVPLDIFFFSTVRGPPS